MSLVAISGNASGTGTLTIAAPNTNSNYTLTLPTATTTIVGTDATQTLTNKTIQGGAITSATAVTLSSQTSVDFTGIPSWVKRITVIITGVKQNTGGANPFTFRIGTSGGIVATGYSGSAGYFGGTPGSTVASTGFDVYFDTSANFYTGSMTITNITGNTWLGVGCFSSTQGYQFVTSAFLALGATLDRVRFTTNNGTNTFTTGTVNIIYE